MRIIVPEAPIAAAAAPAAHRARAHAGLRLGLLDNSKSNADHLFDFLVAGIKSVMPIAAVVRLRKPYASLPAEAHQTASSRGRYRNSSKAKRNLLTSGL